MIMPARLIANLCGWGALALLATASATPATARIRCDGPFMITSQGPIATPYCEEQTIATVAQSYGWKVTAAEIGNKPLTKVYICQVLGSDIRLKGSCAGYGPDQYVPGR
jgi:hypothetical protein